MAPLATKLDGSEKNKINAFLPVRNKGNDFDWDTITGIVLADALGKDVEQYSLDDFRRDCRNRFEEVADPPAFWEVLERMYFSSKAVFNVSPEFLIFKASEAADAVGRPNDRMAGLFRVLMEGKVVDAELQGEVNFLEAEMLAVLRNRLRSGGRAQGGGRGDAAEEPYLPYLAAAFQADLEFLLRHPTYLLQELTNMLRLYAFCYCTQLALNIREWRLGEPRPKKLFFILDTEKASQERKPKKMGYELYRSSSEFLFPYLAALEALQGKEARRPLWRLYEELRSDADQAGLVAKLNEYAAAFAENRGLAPPPAAEDFDGAMRKIFDLAFEQFHSKSSKRSMFQRYANELNGRDSKICKEFVQARGRAGRMLVLTQDRLLLLTNLAIGHADRLRLQELIEAFNRRGIYLDDQSVLELISFYERLGNVERMSDSGDAIYVRKTL